MLLQDSLVMNVQVLAVHPMNEKAASSPLDQVRYYVTLLVFPLCCVGAVVPTATNKMMVC